MRVVIADDAVLFREGVANLLEEAGIEVVGQAAGPDELLLKVRSYEPDVAIVDVRMPPTQTDEGARAAAEIRSRWPRIGVLLLSQVVEAKHTLQLFSERPEGFGYLLKDRVLELDDFVDEQTPEVTIAVVPARRGRGLGKELMEALLEQARRDGIQRLSLSVEPGSSQEQFYARFGFEPVRPGVMVASPAAADGPR